MKIDIRNALYVTAAVATLSLAACASKGGTTDAPAASTAPPATDAAPADTAAPPSNGGGSGG
ncbi:MULTISPECIES: hypothetical protein [unclassified Lysobacter]|uniref:hypothetical protein n=1 Tax=unclassified Lysobacter TaxID=2635362 RepID=UPI001BEAFFEB|nr:MULTISPECIES: hypothetical protein [unclassified Lysobacter]MBT2745594.1 hypothetical protein [Lysobacter sp. ISL-42]MBT2753533.1 hypothetical protein [Lysobacter sp. ISL-50]MBT2777083.1 hypothetical protein [Lysobacter sp. ISL-54]MBT2780291.1 hypothetical protein [Lysobacter sp. ISL-52]